MKSKSKKAQYVIGIDEVGRGPLAGPVSIGVFVVHKKHIRKIKFANDSKKLSESKREKLFGYFKGLQNDGLCNFVVINESATMIDRYGISVCIKRAIKKGLKKIDIQPDDCVVRLDGSLYAPLEYTNQTTIIKGDNKEKVIGAASIVAKVTRDRLMKKLGKKYSEYGFEIHKGYGTKKHRMTIEEFGPSDIHRKTWLTNIL